MTAFSISSFEVMIYVNASSISSLDVVIHARWRYLRLCLVWRRGERTGRADGRRQSSPPPEHGSSGAAEPARCRECASLWSHASPGRPRCGGAWGLFPHWPTIEVAVYGHTCSSRVQFMTRVAWGAAVLLMFAPVSTMSSGGPLAASGGDSDAK